MNLNDLAETDNAIILEDTLGGFGRSVTLTKPAVGATPARVFSVSGRVERIGVVIDPGTGLQVPGSQTRVTVRLSRLAGNDPDETWTVSTTDTLGATISGKVVQPMFDRSAGRLTFFVRK